MNWGMYGNDRLDSGSDDYEWKGMEWIGVEE
jgi:hypothetical protein